RKISRGRFGREEAESLYKAAINSVGIEEGQESIVLEIRECLVIFLTLIILNKAIKHPKKRVKIKAVYK
ncbi:MAG: hypothetical protein GY928_37935, partial [Colwellia sp.]|nr:hypothetical protein [Colwellia sp.]